MRGTNPKRPPLQGNGDVLDVQSVFFTLQGEGPFAGWPAVFIRLGGCNLACDFCDTEFESYRSRPMEEVLREVEILAAPASARLAVITGGEPLRQPIGPLCETLMARGFQVQIETNGTLFRPLPEGVSIVCSPKRAAGGYPPLPEALAARLAALKFLVSTREAGYGEVPEIGQSQFAVPVYVQPMDEYEDAQNQENLALARDIALKKGYRLSLQLHKILDIP